MKCVETYEGREFWIEDDVANRIENTLTLANPPKHIKINGVLIAVNSISGIFDEIDMKEKEYRKQGMYVCEFMRWHGFKEDCNCRNNFRLYGEFGTAPKSKACIEYEKVHGALELREDNNNLKQITE